MRTKKENKNHTNSIDTAQFAEITKDLSKSLEPMILASKQASEQIGKTFENMKPVFDRIAEITDRIAEVTEALKHFRVTYVREYDIIRTKYDAYFQKEGYITPHDADEFLLWLMCKNEYVSDVNLIEEAKNPHNYKLFHEYGLRCLNGDWDLMKELDYWQVVQTDRQIIHKEDPEKQMDLKRLKEDPKKQMDLERLNELFDPKLHINIDRFKSDLKEFAPRYKKMEVAALAWIIYNENLLHKNVKPEDFKKWLQQFCDILGKNKNTYKNATIKETKKTKMKSTYYYLFQQD